MGRGRRSKITCRRRAGGVVEDVEGVDLSVGEGVGSWLSSSIFSFSLFMYVSCDYLPRSCLLGSFVTFSDFFHVYFEEKQKRFNKQWTQFLNTLFLIRLTKR